MQDTFPCPQVRTLSGRTGCFTWNTRRTSHARDVSRGTPAGPRTHGMFHVEHPLHGDPEAQNRGEAARRLLRRGYRSGHSPLRTRALYPAVPVCQPPSSVRPSRPKASAGHLDSASGGSLTTRRPPCARRGAPHSAVIEGAAKLRAVTSEACPRNGPRATSATSAHNTSTLVAMPSSLTAQVRNSHRLPPRSTRTQRPPVSPARIRPGRPPPVPRSTPSWPLSRCMGGHPSTGRRKPVL